MPCDLRIASFLLGGLAGLIVGLNGGTLFQSLVAGMASCLALDAFWHLGSR